jgi:hypothetical protein
MRRSIVKSFIIVFALVLVFPVALAAPDAGQCKPVNATWYLTDYIDGPEYCDGFDYCIPGKLTGTPNGDMTYFAYYIASAHDSSGTTCYARLTQLGSAGRLRLH